MKKMGRADKKTQFLDHLEEMSKKLKIHIFAYL